MYGANVLMRCASPAARSLAWGTDDIAVLGGQALVRVLDHCKRAVRAGAVKFQRTAGLENARGGDLRPMVFHPIRHVHENVVLVADCGRSLGRLVGISESESEDRNRWFLTVRGEIQAD